MWGTIEVRGEEGRFSTHKFSVRRHDPGVRNLDEVVVVTRTFKSQLAGSDIAIVEGCEYSLGSSVCG